MLNDLTYTAKPVKNYGLFRHINITCRCHRHDTATCRCNREKDNGDEKLTIEDIMDCVGRDK